MPDAPDWQRYLPGSERYALSDMSELAARLGSPLRFDRRGEVIWYDQFDHGLNPWTADKTGTGAAVAATTDDTFMALNAAKLTAGSNAGQEATILKNLTQPVLGRWGVEVAVAFKTSFDHFLIMMKFYDGTNLLDVRIKVSDDEDEIQYLDTATNWQSIATLPNVIVTEATYQLFKLVCDFDKGEFVSLRYGATDFDLSGIAIKTSSDSNAPRIQNVFRLIGRSGNNDVAQVGHVIFTANEP